MAKEDILITTIEGKDFTILETDDGYKTPLTEPKGWFYTTQQYIFPKSAHVHLHDIEENWEGRAGKSVDLHISPPGKIVYRDSNRTTTSSEVKLLLGKKLTIYPDKTFSPPELFDVLQFAEEKLGYTIDQEVLEALGIGDKDLDVFLGSL